MRSRCISYHTQYWSVWLSTLQLCGLVQLHLVRKDKRHFHASEFLLAISACLAKCTEFVKQIKTRLDGPHLKMSTNIAESLSLVMSRWQCDLAPGGVWSATRTGCVGNSRRGVIMLLCGIISSATHTLKHCKHTHMRKYMLMVPLLHEIRSTLQHHHRNRMTSQSFCTRQALREQISGAPYCNIYGIWEASQRARR